MERNIPSNENQRPAKRLLYPARLSIKMEGEIRSFPDKRSLKELLQTSSARNAKGSALRTGKKNSER